MPRVSDIDPGTALYGVPSERTDSLGRGSQGIASGLVCVAPSEPLTDGVGSVLDREVD